MTKPVEIFAASTDQNGEIKEMTLTLATIGIARHCLLLELSNDLVTDILTCLSFPREIKRINLIALLA